MTSEGPGLQERLEAHIQRNRDRLLATLAGWGVAKDRAEDLLHDGVIKAMSALDQLQDEAQLEGWFHRILRNTTMDFHRRRDRENRRDAKWSGEAIRFYVPEFRSNSCQCVHDVITTLKPEYGEAIRNAELGESELEDVATRLGITYNNLKVRLHRARRQLRERLMDTCASCAEAGCLDCTCGIS